MPSRGHKVDQVSLESHRSNIYHLEDILTYYKCPLRQKYRSWGAVEIKIDAREAVEQAATGSIGAYLQEAAKPNASRAKALESATKHYKSILLHHDKNHVFDGTGQFVEHFNFGLVVIRRFDELLNPLYDRPVHGPIELTYELDGYAILGHLTGLISFNDKSSAERTYGVVLVGPSNPARTTWERIQEGFVYGTIRRALSGMKHYPIQLIRIDPHKKKTQVSIVSNEDLATFEALSITAIKGIEAGVFPPQPSQVACGLCPFERACKLKYSKTDKWTKASFLADLKVT